VVLLDVLRKSSLATEAEERKRRKISFPSSDKKDEGENVRLQAVSYGTHVRSFPGVNL